MPDDRFGRPGLPRNGHHANGVSVPPPYTRVLSAEPDEAPLDLVAVQADDELVNALGARPAGAYGAVAGPPAGDRHDAHLGDDQLVALLASWRAEIDAEPIPELIDLDTAVAAVMAGVDAQKLTGRRTRANRLRQLAPLVAAAAIIVATVTGVGLGSQNAMPGDTLWTVQKVVNPERADSVEAKIEVESRLETVRSALEKGDTVTAAHELEQIRTQLPAVRGQEGQPQLAQEQEFLAAKLVDTPPGTPADLKTPAKSNPKARSTSSPAPPASSDPSSTGSSATGPSKSGSTAPQATDPAARDKAKAGAPVVPADPKSSGPAQSAPPEPQVTSPPVEPKPEPTGPVNGEGGPDKSTPPAAPVEPPPSSTTAGTASQGGGSGADTTTASGSAGANVSATATGTTS